MTGSGRLQPFRDRTPTLLDRNNLAPVPSFIPFGAPVIHEAGHYAKLSFLHKADGVRYASVTASDDQLVAIKFDLVDEQSQGTVKLTGKVRKCPGRMGNISRLRVLSSFGTLVERESKAVTRHQSGGYWNARSLT